MLTTITTRLFLAVMVLAGLVTGVGAHVFPAAAHGSFPSYTWPLLIAFVCEALMRPRIEAGILPALPMVMRFVGVIGATLIGYAVETALDQGVLANVLPVD